MPSTTRQTPANAAGASAASAAPSPQAASAARSQWTKTFSNGDSYKGEALHVHDAGQKPIKDGHGRYTWASSGAVYEGEWRNGRPHGEGVMTVPGPDGYEYTGSFVEGQRSGRGRCHFANGRTYEGEWREDEMNGQGTVRGAPGVDDYAEYTGAFEVGKRSGAQGRCVYLNSDIYDGAWLAGKRQGMGEWWLHQRPTSSSSLAVAVVRYKGPFDQDVPHTSGSVEGEVDYADGGSYVGAVSAQLRRHGRGVHRLASGDVFDGTFTQDQRDGRGTLQTADGMVCEGTWRRGQLDGVVHVTFPMAADSKTAHASGAPATTSAAAVATAGPTDVTSDVRNLQQLCCGANPVVSYEGPCSAGVLSGGDAVLLYADGSSYRGAVRHGLPHGRGVLRDRPLPATSADGEGRGGLRRRIAAACLPPHVAVTLVSYDGAFAAGEPEGAGTAEWHVAAGLDATVPVDDPLRTVTPFNFAQRLAEGLAWWRGSSYAAQDGTYTGAWLRGLPHGQGKWQWTDGSAYSGELAFYLPAGQGTYTSPQLQYTGEFKDGQPDGKGVLDDRVQGISYEGVWSAGRPHGDGVCTVTTDGTISSSSVNNSGVPGIGLSRALPSPPSASVASPCTVVYEGMWQDGKPAGLGRTYANADRQRVVYDGAYVDGECEGRGTLYFGSVRRGSLNGDAAAAAVHAYAQYSGAFTHGHPGGGPGCLTLKNNTTVEGVFDAALQPKSDVAITVKPHNEAWTFTGTFDPATRLGHGTMKFPNGDVYKGDVEDVSVDSGDGAATETASSASPPPQQQQHQQPLLYNLQRHGQGVYSFVEGNQLQCTWRHNVLHGAGVYTAADGTKTERTYADGVLANDTGLSSVRASGGLSSIGAGGGAVGNVFTPENEFPNTLSEEALKGRMPDGQSQHQPESSPQQQQQRKRAPFSFVRRGEARQASTAGTAAAAAAPSTSSVNSPSPRGAGADGRVGGSVNGTGKVVRRTPPAQSLSPVAAAAHRSSTNTNTTPRRASSPPTSTGSNGNNGGGGASQAANAPSAQRRSSGVNARTPTGGAASTPSQAAAAAAHAEHKYSLRRQPAQNAVGNTGSNNTANNGASAPSSTRTANDKNGRGDNRTQNSTSLAVNGSAAGGKGNTLPTANSVYLTRFQAGIRQLDKDAPRSPSPSGGQSAGASPTSSASRAAPGGSLPVTTPAWESGPLRRRLSSALAAGREQQQQQPPPQHQSQPSSRSVFDVQPLPQKPSVPVTLEGSLKEMMAAACNIRSSREDEIHLLTEEMRQLNERIWQLRYVIEHDNEGGTTTAAAAKSPSRANPPSPGRRLSKNAAGGAGAEKESPASKTQRLAALMQERRVIMEKLQYVVSAPE